MPVNSTAPDSVNILTSDSLQQDLRSDAGVGFCSWDTNTQTLSLDAVALRHYGVSECAEITDDLVLDRVHPEDRENLLNMFRKVKKNEGAKLRYRVLLEDGGIRHLEVFVRRSESNTSNYIILDVTESVAARLALDEERRRFSELASGVPVSYSYLDRDSSVLFMSDEMRKDTGLVGQDVTGRLLADLLSPEMWAQRKEKFVQALAGERQVWQTDTVDINGCNQHSLLTFQPNFDEGGKVCGVFALQIDITEIHQLEVELRDAQENLLRSNKDLEQFAYVASHDLKAPLRAIQVLIEWLQEDLVDYSEGDVQENVGLLGKRAARLSVLLDDLLAYSRAGRQSEQPTCVDLPDIVSEIAGFHQGTSNSVVRWQGEEAAELVTDHAALHTVMRNLIGNAIKHHPGPDCQIDVSAEPQGELLEISVVDNGDGIKPEFSEKIFQMFQTLKPRDEVEGSGMGLAIVKRLVNQHGGRIWFEEPASGIGTVFKFTWRPTPAPSQ